MDIYDYLIIEKISEMGTRDTLVKLEVCKILRENLITDCEGAFVGIHNCHENLWFLGLSKVEATKLMDGVFIHLEVSKCAIEKFYRLKDIKLQKEVLCQTAKPKSKGHFSWRTLLGLLWLIAFWSAFIAVWFRR